MKVILLVIALVIVSGAKTKNGTTNPPGAGPSNPSHSPIHYITPVYDGPCTNPSGCTPNAAIVPPSGVSNTCSGSACPTTTSSAPLATNVVVSDDICEGIACKQTSKKKA